MPIKHIITLFFLFCAMIIHHSYKSQYKKKQIDRNLTKYEKMLVEKYGNIENF